jgi:hypothetical protein
MVEIGGMSLSSPPNLGTLTHQGAGSSETEAFRPVTLVGVHGLGKSLSNLGPLGKYGEMVLRNPSTSGVQRISKSLIFHHCSGSLFFPQRGGLGIAIPCSTR